MLRSAVLGCALATATAFAPGSVLPKTGSVARATSPLSGLSMQAKSKAMPFLSQPDNLDGKMAGDVGFDPLGFSYYVDLKWLREAELKHGRVCMLAWTGCIVPEVVRLPGDAFNHKFALDAWGSAPRGGMISIIMAIGLIELISNRFAMTPVDMFANPNRKPGNLGFDPLQLGNNAEVRAKYELAEVTHGRAAMMGFSGVIHQMIVTKQPVIDQMLHFKSVTPGVFKLGGAAGALGY